VFRSLLFRIRALAGLAFGLSLSAFPLFAQQPADGAAPPPEQVESRLKQAASREPDSFAANFALGGFYAQAGEAAKAIPYLEKAHKIDPSHYECGHDLALAYLKTGRLAEARELLNGMIARNDKAGLHNLLGAVEERAGEIVQAAKQMQRAAEMDATEQHVFDYGNILLKYGAGEGALKIFRYGAGKFPRSARMKVGLGVALYSRGYYDDAVETLCEAVDLNPEDPRPLSFLGELHDVSAAMAEEVTKRLAHFARQYPESAEANYYYALSLWKINQPDPPEDVVRQVESLLKKALARNPRLHEAHYQLGLVYERQERWEDATGAYRKALDLKPDYARAYYRLGQTYLRLGKRKQAKQALDAYQRLHKKNRQEEEKQKPPQLLVK